MIVFLSPSARSHAQVVSYVTIRPFYAPATLSARSVAVPVSTRAVHPHTGSFHFATDRVSAGSSVTDDASRGYVPTTDAHYWLRHGTDRIHASGTNVGRRVPRAGRSVSSSFPDGNR